MEFLRLLEGIRNPVLDGFFSFVTQFGEETLFMLIGIIFFWCVSKKQGYYLLFIGLLGTVVNQFLKLCFRVARPWVLDENFTVVESARESAGGYSFPSGHTQTAVGSFGGIALMRREKWLRIISIVLCVLVPFSRMYLGVHTPLDVGASIAISLLMVFAFYPLVNKAMEKPALMRVILASLAVLTAAYLIFVEFYNFPADIDMHNYESGLKNGYKMLGCFLALWLTYEVDNRYTKFETSAPIIAQVLKVALGVVPVVLIKSLLKQPLIALIGVETIADGVRYFLICAFAGVVWPMTFKYFAKIGAKKDAK